MGRTCGAAIWDARSGEILTELVGHRDEVLDWRFSPDGKRVLTTSDDETVRLWEVESGRELIRLEGRAALFSSDGTRIITWTKDGVVRVFDSVPYGARVHPVAGH